MVALENFNPLLQRRHEVIRVHHLAQKPPLHGGFSAKIAA
jgi:hypothetical protein